MRESRLQTSQTNLFQKIKAQCARAEENGKTLYRLSIGQPRGPALLSARRAAAEAVMSDQECMHEYQDNGCPGAPNFARDFVHAHFSSCPDPAFMKDDEISYLPIPGIKPMLGLIPKACGGIGGHKISVYTMTSPGYPTPADQARYLGMIHSSLPTIPENQFRFSPSDICDGIADLVMTNYPHNPSGQVATQDWWMEMCEFCQKYNIRIFNDAAYAILIHDRKEACCLTEVATSFPKLSWAEAFSASKVIGNGTGWRVGAICGSPDFVSDIATIKGNTDSGLFAPAAAGVLAAMKNDRASIEEYRQTYERRIEILVGLLRASGMKLAVEPRAGFFTLWLAPTEAFGEGVIGGEQFNNVMIENAGIVGVPFGQYIRYAVTSPIEEWRDHIFDSFRRARVSYAY